MNGSKPPNFDVSPNIDNLDPIPIALRILSGYSSVSYSKNEWKGSLGAVWTYWISFIIFSLFLFTSIKFFLSFKSIKIISLS